MGNQQSFGGNLLQGSCTQGLRSLNQGRQYRQLSLADSESGSSFAESNTDDEGNHTGPEESCSSNDSHLSDAARLENIVLTDDLEELKKVCLEPKLDLNLQLNDKRETILMLAVKLSNLEMVKTLLVTPVCDKNYQNVQYFTPLDVALVTAFDNRLEPRQTICWNIIQCLLQVDAEPNSKNAMMYVIRTALKENDERFIYHLILLAEEFSFSTMLHELILQKLHRCQPVYMESLDPIFACAAGFTIKLLKNANGNNLWKVINSMTYYLDSYWHSSSDKILTFKRLIIYATGAGWQWSVPQLKYINRVCLTLVTWCKEQRSCPSSLCHLSRLAYRHNLQCQMSHSFEKLPHKVPDAIKDYIMLKDIDDIVHTDNFSMSEVHF